MTVRPEPGEELRTAASRRHAAPGGDGDPAPGRRRSARGAAGQAQPRAALHGRRLGVPRRRRRRRRGRRATPRTARRACARSQRRRAIELPDPDALVRFSRWITPAMVKIRFDTHFFLAAAPDGRRPAARRRRDRRPRLVHARRARSRPTSATRSCSCSRRSRRSSSSAAFATADELLEWAPRPRGRARRAAGRPRGPDRPDRAAGRTRVRNVAEGERRRRSSLAWQAKPMIVAVTGPTGDIGRALLRALDADPLVERVLGMARRAFDPASLGPGEDRVPPGRRARPRRGRRARRRGRRARAPRVHHPRRPRGDALDQPRGLAQRLRGRPRREAARLHVVGRRLRLPRRQPAAADRGRPGARHRRALLLGAEGRARGDAARGARRRGHRDLRVPAVHRRRRRRARARRGVPRAAAQVARRPVLPDPGTPFQLVHTDDVALALAAAVRGRGRAGRLQPRRRRDDHRRRPRARVRLALRADARKAGVALAAGRVDLLPFMPAQASWLNAFRVPVVMDTDARARAARLGAALRHAAVLADTAAHARDAGLL